MSKEILSQIIKDYQDRNHFRVLNLQVSDVDRSLWVQILVDPEAFRKKMFDGVWADPKKHPDPGLIRILRVITGNDGVTRVIGRQENYLYAYPLERD
jgi:hypothetical protein